MVILWVLNCLRCNYHHIGETKLKRVPTSCPKCKNRYMNYFSTVIKLEKRNGGGSTMAMTRAEAEDIKNKIASEKAKISANLDSIINLIEQRAKDTEVSKTAEKPAETKEPEKTDTTEPTETKAEEKKDDK